MIDFKAFQRPQRYIGNEWNAVRKSHRGKIRICLSYPDLYEIGMSNLGLRIIYGLLNEYRDVVCERVFMPGLDLAAFLTAQKKSLPSLESKTPLNRFEVLGFNFNYELNFTNFLAILDLGRISLWAKERKDIIVIGGGLANPEPIADFLDVFYLGEFEAGAENFIEVLRRCKSKDDRLKALSAIPGFYVPKLYSAGRQGSRYRFAKKSKPARSSLARIYVKDLDDSYFPRNWLTPYTQITQDRVAVEIARGCPNRCTFCQARAVYSPYREREVSTIKDIVEKVYQNSGYEDFSFLSLSASDYSSIEGLVDSVYDYCKEKRIGLSLPSLRADREIGSLYKRLIPLKKTTFTVALEAARDCRRQALNKRIDVDKIFAAVEVIRSLGQKHIKIYFMYGFPDETEEDLSAIGIFISNLTKRFRINLNLSINIFLPKPFSTWEDREMEDEAVLRQKKIMILESIPRKRSIKVSTSPIKKSILEGVCSRGDRRLSTVIYQAYQRGARFDGYGESFSWGIWEESFKDAGLDYRFYLKQSTENFPWSFIQSERSEITKIQETMTKQ